MKIGLITPAWPGTQTANGITTAVHYLARGLRETGQDVIIMPFSQDGPADEIPVVPLLRRSWSLSQKLRGKLEIFTGRDGVAVEVQAIRIVEAVRQAQQDHGLDVIVMEETQGWAGYLQRQIEIPVVITLHCPWFMQRGLRNRNTTKADNARERREAGALRGAVGITAPSHDVLEATQAEVGLSAGIPQAVVRNPIYLPDCCKIESSTGMDGCNLLFVGRFDRLKGGDTVLAAFKILARFHKSAKLTFVGPDQGLDQADGTRRHIDDVLSELAPEIRARISYLGQRNAAEIEDLRCRHAIALVASRYETLGYTMLEAMSHGAALVATNAGGPAELLRHEETALLVPPDDPQAMATACTRLLNDLQLRSSIGTAAQDVIRREFQPAVVATQMAGFLREVIARYASGGRS